MNTIAGVSDVPTTGTGTGAGAEAPAPTGAKRGTGAGAKVFPGIFHGILWNKVKISEVVSKNHKNGIFAYLIKNPRTTTKI